MRGAGSRRSRFLSVNPTALDHLQAGFYAHFDSNEKRVLHGLVFFDQNKMGGFAALPADRKDLFHRGPWRELDGVDLLETVERYFGVPTSAQYVPGHLAIVETVDLSVAVNQPSGGAEFSKQFESILLHTLTGQDERRD
jgi:hypothetical protein